MAALAHEPQVENSIQSRPEGIFVECLPTTVVNLVEECDKAERLVAVVPDLPDQPLAGLLGDLTEKVRQLIALEPNSSLGEKARVLEIAIAARCLKLWSLGERRLLLGSATVQGRDTLVLAFAKRSLERCSVSIN